jgi:carbon-monoxide dehydrogenase medium subunit
VKAFDYAAPASLDEALSLLKEHGSAARVLAGGTDLIVQVREGRRDVGVILDVKRIPEFMEVAQANGGGLRIGAAVPCAQLYHDPEIARAYPALIDSASLIGGIQIQSRASIGGNLCNSSPAADAIPTLIALGATCEIAGPSGKRSIPVEEFCTGPGSNALAPDEVLVSLTLSAAKPHFGAAFERFIPRNEMDIAVCNAAAGVTLSDDGSTFASARIAVGAVAPTPLLVREAGDALVGQAVSPGAIENAARAAAEAARPITDMRGSAAQRKHLAGVLTRRVIEKAIERAKGA